MVCSRPRETSDDDTSLARVFLQANQYFEHRESLTRFRAWNSSKRLTRLPKSPRKLERESATIPGVRSSPTAHNSRTQNRASASRSRPTSPSLTEEKSTSKSFKNSPVSRQAPARDRAARSPSSTPSKRTSVSIC